MKENMKKLIEGINIIYRIVRGKKVLFSICIFLFSLLFLLPFVNLIFLRKYFDAMTHSDFTIYKANEILLPYYGVVILSALLIVLGGIADSFYRFRITNALRQNILGKLLNKKSEAKNISMGEMINSIKEDAETLTQPIGFLEDIVGHLIFTIGALIYAYKIDSAIASVMIFPMIMVVIFSNLLSTSLRNYRKKARECSSRVSAHLGDITSNILSIKVNDSEENIIKELDRLGHERRKYQVKTKLAFELMWSLSDLISGLGLSAILFMCAYRVKSGKFNTTDIFIFSFLLPRIAGFLQVFGRFISNIQSASVSFDRVKKILGKHDANDIFDMNSALLKHVNKPFVRKNLSPLGVKSFEVKNLSSTFDGQGGVKDVSFKLNKGEFLAITGRIGSGKSTLVKALVGVKDIESGNIYCDGEDITNKQGIIPPTGSYTSQNPNLFSETIKDNIILGNEVDEERLKEAINDSVLINDLTNLKDGVNTMVGSKGVKLSGGQKQRVAVARMLYHDSDIFILDDVSSALDVDTEIKLWNNLKNKDRTRIAVTNRHVALKNADKILVLKDGSVDSIGSLEELLKTSKEFRKIWGEAK